jgi:hypothetical protein
MAGHILAGWRGHPDGFRRGFRIGEGKCVRASVRMEQGR